MKTPARFLLLGVLATADLASAKALSRTAAGRALGPSAPGRVAERTDLGGDAAQAAVAVTGGQEVEQVRELYLSGS